MRSFKSCKMSSSSDHIPETTDHRQSGEEAFAAQIEEFARLDIFCHCSSGDGVKTNLEGARSCCAR